MSEPCITEMDSMKRGYPMLYGRQDAYRGGLLPNVHAVCDVKSVEVPAIDQAAHVFDVAEGVCPPLGGYRLREECCPSRELWLMYSRSPR